jgi:hypothetical protein
MAGEKKMWLVQAETSEKGRGTGSQTAKAKGMRAR